MKELFKEILEIGDISEATIFCGCCRSWYNKPKDFICGCNNCDCEPDRKMIWIKGC